MRPDGARRLRQSSGAAERIRRRAVIAASGGIWRLDSHARAGAGGQPPLTRESLERWQTRALRAIAAYAKQHSPFYARHLSDARIESPRDIELLPFTYASSLKEDSQAFLCVPPDDVARVATFASSGTSGAPKRIFFTDDDLENTIEFFAAGMSHIPGTRTLICMGDPGKPPAPGSVAALLTEALSRTGRAGIAGGFVTDPDKSVELLQASNADSIVGIPSQLLAMARCPSVRGAQKKISLQGILLSGEYASEGLVSALRGAFGCPVFRHFGMAETGYGAAVECRLHCGLHIREADLLIEIAGADSDEILPDGQWGEIVITTLTRRGMPLIRFRTGDLGRVLPGVCPCGSVLKRLEVLGRLNALRLKALRLHDLCLRLPDLDDALHPLPWLSDYDARAGYGGAAVLYLTLYCAGRLPADWRAQARQAIDTIEPLRPALSSGMLRVDFGLSRRPISPYSGKKVLR